MGAGGGTSLHLSPLSQSQCSTHLHSRSKQHNGQATCGSVRFQACGRRFGKQHEHMLCTLQQYLTQLLAEPGGFVHITVVLGQPGGLSKEVCKQALAG